LPSGFNGEINQGRFGLRAITAQDKLTIADQKALGAAQHHGF
jgi:hypothetical protein